MIQSKQALLGEPTIKFTKYRKTFGWLIKQKKTLNSIAGLNQSFSFINVLILFAINSNSYAQPLTEITGKRLYEHHSSSINGGADIGTAANGSQSGYDFVNHSYYSSYDEATFGPYANGEESNIDMVEQNGPYGNGMGFGFTSGYSSIWSGLIQGNNLTKYLAIGPEFYNSISDVSEIKNAYDTLFASTSGGSVSEGAIYIARVRESDLYIAIRIYNVVNVSGPLTGQMDISFDFDYKYGTYISTVNVKEVKNNPKIRISSFPNSTIDKVYIDSSLPIEKINVFDITGKIVFQNLLNSASNVNMDFTAFPPGLYFIQFQTPEGIITNKIIKKS